MTKRPSSRKKPSSAEDKSLPLVLEEKKKQGNKGKIRSKELSTKAPEAVGSVLTAIRAADPWLDEEGTRYEAPLPSRKYILQLLTERGVPTYPDTLGELLAIKPTEQEAFHRRLAAMERDGQVMRNRKGALCLVDKVDLRIGRVEGHPEGFGFFIPDDGSGDLYLSPRQMRQVLHGDRVTVKLIGQDSRGRQEGAIVDVLQRGHARLVGRLYQDHGVWFFVAEDRRISQDILIPADAIGAAKSEDIVCIQIITPPTLRNQAVGSVIEVLGEDNDSGIEIEIALRKHDLPFMFSAAAEAQAAKLPKKVRKVDCQNREDLRHLPLVTIDGETAKDFDDAVYAEKAGRGFRLLVAIADVSHYVQDGDALDQDARERGNSAYFPRRVIPMLPEALSNGLCSLNPQVDRLCLVCDMYLSPVGKIQRYSFYPAVIYSQARLTYTQVAAWLGDEQTATTLEEAKLLPHLKTLQKVYTLLRKNREIRGAIDFESVETAFTFDAHGKIEAIKPVVRNEAHRIIEECMLAANVCAAEYLLSKGQPALFRIHEGPTPEKLTKLREFLGGFALSLGGGDEPTPQDYAQLIAKVQHRPDQPLLQTVMLRSLQQAVYSPENGGHFGLAYGAYTHFTSPIRRYPDLLIHRAIKAVLTGTRYTPQKDSWESLGLHCSTTERRADEASREVISWLKCYYLKDRIGEVFQGTISGITHFGAFVSLDELSIDGLIHITELGNDYFHHDATHHTLRGERTGKVFRLADRLAVQLAQVNLETSRVDFILASATTGPPAGQLQGKKGAVVPKKVEKSAKVKRAKLTS